MRRPDFARRVVEVVRGVPVGKVVSYSQVAAYVGVPTAARAVGWILRQARDEKLPWWRVINNSGRISIRDNWEHDAVEQRELLRREGVEVGENFGLDMTKYRFVASCELMRKWRLPNEYLEVVWGRFRT